MRHAKDFLADVLVPVEPGGERRSWYESDALPMSARLGERLSEMLILASELQADLQSEEAAELRWIAPEIDQVFDQIDALLQRLAA